MINIITEFLKAFIDVYLEMAPFLLFGFLVAGIISAFISPQAIEKHLGKKNIFSIVKAAILGVPLPLCSCGVIPVAASLRRSGASTGATIAFIMSTPKTGIDSILIALALLGPVYAIFIPIAALISGIIGGIVISLLIPPDKEEKALSPVKCQGDCCIGRQEPDKIRHIFHYAFITMPKDIGKALIIGLAIAGIISTIIPEDFFSRYLGNDFLSMIVMMLVGIPLYVCASASIPIAASLILKGISPGAALVFLMSGPATNAATITTLLKVVGKKATIMYLVMVAITALGAGLVLNYVFSTVNLPPGREITEFLPEMVKIISGIILLAILIYSSYHRDKQEVYTTTLMKDLLNIKASGIDCLHCAETINNALKQIKGVDEITVNISNGMVKVIGTGFNTQEIVTAMENLGYKVDKFDIQLNNTHNDCENGSCNH